MVSAGDHGLELVQKIISSEERDDKLEKFVLVEDALNVAEENLHDIIIGAFIGK